MRELSNLILNYNTLFYYINIVELFIGIFIMLFSVNSKLYKILSSIIATYMGIAIGCVIGFRLSYTMSGMICGIVVGVLIAILLIFFIKQIQINIVWFAVIFKVVLISFVIIDNNDINTLKVILAIIIAALVGLLEYIINKTDSISDIYAKYLYGGVGVLEVSAAIVCWHRYDLISVLKFLPEEYYDFFSYILKVDLTSSGQMEDFLFLLFVLVILEIFYINKFDIIMERKANK